MTNSGMDWGDLASSQLPSISDETLNSQWSQRFAPLQSNSQSAGSQQRNSFGFDSIGAPVTLPPTWTSNPLSVHDGSFLKNIDSKARTSNETLEEKFARYENDIINNLLRKTAREQSQRRDMIVDSQLLAAWERDRDQCLQQIIGKRYLGGASIHQRSSVHSNESKIFGSESDRVTSIVPRVFLSQADNLDTLMAKEHLRVVKDSLIVDRNKSLSGSLGQCIDRLRRILTDRDSNGGIMDGKIAAYSSSLNLLSEIALSASHSDPIDQAKAALTHLSKQFKAFVQNHADYYYKNSSTGVTDQTTRYNSNLASQCLIFTRNENMIGLNQQVNSWALVYYCLRCGDAGAALEVLQSDGTFTSQSEQPLIRILTDLARSQRNAEYVWMVPFPTLNVDDLASMDNLWNTVKRDDPTNIYRLGVYSLFAHSGQPETSENIVGFKTIEDYLTVLLFKAFVGANAIDELKNIGHMISDEFGPDYFHDTTSGGWSFAFPLLLTQQYEKSLTYLVKAGGEMGLFYACHMGLILHFAGIPVSDVGTTPTDNTVLSSLLAEYANILLSDPTNFGSLAALEYLVRIPSPRSAQREVAKLLATTLEIEKLVGTLNSDGIRQNSVLTQFFESSEVSVIMGEAANILFAEKDNLQKMTTGVMCLMLGERFGDVLSVLNQVLSPPRVQDENKQFWIDQTKQFHHHFLSKTTHVSESLDRSRKLHLVQTNRFLLDLNDFEFYRARSNHANAWNVAEGLPFVPKSQSQVAACQLEYQRLDNLVKDAVPTFLSGLLGILYKQYLELKQQIHSTHAAVVQERLNELKNRARVLTTFAASAGLPSEQIGNLTSIASLIV